MCSVKSLEHLKQVKSCCQVSMSVQIDVRKVMVTCVIILKLVNKWVNLSHNGHFELLLLDHEKSHGVEHHEVSHVVQHIWS